MFFGHHSTAWQGRNHEVQGTELQCNLKQAGLKKVLLCIRSQWCEAFVARVMQRVAQRLLLTREKAHSEQKNTSDWGAHASKDARGIPAFLLGKPSPQAMQMVHLVTRHELENRHGISSAFFALTRSSSVFPRNYLISPYSWAIHGPVRKPSCSQFNTSESPSVIIIAVESREWRGCFIFQSVMSSIPVNITLLLKFMVIFSINFIYKLISSNFSKALHD